MIFMKNFRIFFQLRYSLLRFGLIRIVQSFNCNLSNAKMSALVIGNEKIGIGPRQSYRTFLWYQLRVE